MITEYNLPGYILVASIIFFSGWLFGALLDFSRTPSGTQITEYHDLVTDKWNVDVKVYDKKGELIASGVWKWIDEKERNSIIKKYKK